MVYSKGEGRENGYWIFNSQLVFLFLFSLYHPFGIRLHIEPHTHTNTKRRLGWGGDGVS